MRLLLINECAQCRHRYGGYRNGTCGYGMRENWRGLTDGQTPDGPIPDWCPLEHDGLRERIETLTAQYENQLANARQDMCDGKGYPLLNNYEQFIHDMKTAAMIG